MKIGRLDDIDEIQSRRRQHFAEILQHATRLEFDPAFDDRARRRVERDLPRAKYQSRSARPPANTDRSRPAPAWSESKFSSIATAVLLAEPRHAHHAVDRANRVHQVVQLPRAGHADLEHRQRAPVSAVSLHFSRRDIHARRRDRLGHRSEQARLIGAQHFETNRPRRFFTVLPHHRHAPLRIGVERMRASRDVHRNAAPARDESRDRLARQRIAASREPHQHIADARNHHRAAGGFARFLARHVRAARGPSGVGGFSGR